MCIDRETWDVFRDFVEQIIFLQITLQTSFHVLRTEIDDVDLSEFKYYYDTCKIFKI